MRAAQAKIKLMFPQRRTQERAAKNLKRELLKSNFQILFFYLFRIQYFFGLIFILPRNELKQFLVLSKKCRPIKIFYECNSYLFSLSFKSDLAA